MVFGNNRLFIEKQHRAFLTTPDIDKVLPHYVPLSALKTSEVVELATGNFERLIKMMKLADLVTVSTPHLKKSYTGWGVKNIKVLPNQEKASEWQNIMKTPLLGRVVIGWAGGVAHYFTDLKPIREAVVRVMKENPQVHLHILGVPEAKDLFDIKDRVFTEPWSNWENYKTNVAEFDISLAPAFGNRKFNQGKSDIRCLQSWICGNPVVASEVTYGQSVIDSGGGILADNPLEWYEALTLLVNNAQQRQEIGTCGKEYVLSKRTYEGHAEEWAAAYLTF
jgi:glycosyltransferase involved in cell wall biosynthesis